MATAIALKVAKKHRSLALPRLLSWRCPGILRFCNSGLELLSQSLPEAESEMESNITSFAQIPGRKVLETFVEEFEIGSRTIRLETGKIARFANGSVVIRMDDTNVLSTVSSAKTDGSRDFLPLSISPTIF
ncbi:hypothetical protein HPP92_011351 [Vanilla planifolia]|uniref:Exoribonuclease phosphorolytic domain-containing protein n=1 Tax=Vanilla planifolia TaxID=51239 RepID=A0A835RC74_VANPL|nr:hypothetical protein HPP92_011351 [Vanilla planifolia]